MISFFNPPSQYKFQHDFIAGVTVGVITISQAMAFALLAGLPPIYGLYGAFIPLLVYAFLGSSNFLNVGPVSIISIFVFDSLSPFVSPFTDAYVIAVVNLGLLIGLIQFLAGVLKLGRYIDFLPKSVVSGFIQAAAVVIIISQLSPGLGITTSLKAGYLERLQLLWLQIDQLHILTTTLFLGALFVLFAMAKAFPQFPTAISLLIVSGGAAFAFDLEALGVDLIGEVPQGLPQLLLPQFTQESWLYLPSAFGIAFVSSVGSFVMAKNVTAHQLKQWQPNQDLMALGMTKIVSAFFGALVPAGSFNRSILTMKSGAKTQMAGLVASAILILTLLFLTPVVYFLPQAVIAAVIVYSVYFLFDFPLIKLLWRTAKKQFLYLALTAIVTLGVGFVEGILFGLVVSLIGEYLFRSKEV